MTIKASLLIAVIAGAIAPPFAFGGDRNIPGPPPVAGTTQTPKDSPSVEWANPSVEANNAFAIKLHTQLAKEQSGKNLFYSPFSMSSALAMLAEGARGETAEQMGRTLCYPAAARVAGSEAPPWNMARVHAGMAELNTRFNPKPVPQAQRDRIAALRKELDNANRLVNELHQKGVSSGNMKEADDLEEKAKSAASELNALFAKGDPYELRTANAIWSEKTRPVLESYADTLARFYGTGSVNPVDFITRSEPARLQINGRVEERTKGRIKDLFPTGSITTQTRLVLANALYFKGEWLDPFDATRTKTEDFRVPAGSRVGVPMMREKFAVKYGAFQADGSLFPTPLERALREILDPEIAYPGAGGIHVVELPYKGGDLSMVILLPLDVDGLAKLEASLNRDTLHAWMGKLQRRDVQVHIPKFKLEMTYDRMSKTLESLGMKRAFQPSAQFDGMFEPGPEPIFVSVVIHKTFVEVNEKGTEAAAATGITMRKGGPPPMVPFIPEFRADHPFLFLIRDVKTDAILFMGRMVDPTAK
jgi:serine protease inhibitor